MKITFDTPHASRIVVKENGVMIERLLEIDTETRIITQALTPASDIRVTSLPYVRETQRRLLADFKIETDDIDAYNYFTSREVPITLVAKDASE